VGDELSAAGLEGLDRRAQSEDGRRRRALFDLLHFLERTQATGVLRLSLEDTALGCVVAREGRLCFAVAGGDPAPGPAAEGDGQARARLSVLARQARDEGTSFSAALLGEPTEEVARLRGQLLLETAAALRLLAESCCRHAVLREVVRGRADYDPRLTFSAAEVYCAAIRIDERPDRDAITELFDGLRPGGDAGLLLAREPGREPMPYPVAAFGLSEATLHDLLSLSRCAGELMRPSLFLGAVVEPTYAVMRGGVGEHWVCVASGRHLALIERRDGADPAPVIAHTLRSH